MKEKIIRRALICFFCSILISASPVWAQTSEEPDDVKSASAATQQSDYIIGSGDILNILTWKEPDFTMEAMVRIDGKITFPLLDDIQAAGRTSVAVKEEIQEKLKDYIADPIVTVIVKQTLSQKFYILGEVMKTGEYPLLKDLHVLQAFALAGGFTEWASKNEIILLRREDGEPMIISIKYKDIIKGKNLKQDLKIRAKRYHHCSLIVYLPQRHRGHGVYSFMDCPEKGAIHKADPKGFRNRKRMVGDRSFVQSPLPDRAKEKFSVCPVPQMSKASEW